MILFGVRNNLSPRFIFMTLAKHWELYQNGGEIYDHQRNYPLRGGKTTVFEGGHRVRAFINSKLLKFKSFVYDGMFHSVDWLPTILSAATNKPTSKYFSHNRL